VIQKGDELSPDKYLEDLKVVIDDEMEAKKKRLAELQEKVKIAKIPKGMVLDNDSQDYSHLYRNFYDIFVGHHNGIKDFDLNYCVRDARNVYASFVNLLDTNALLMQQKARISWI